jgi:hypothetical protein
MTEDDFPTSPGTPRAMNAQIEEARAEIRDLRLRIGNLERALRFADSRLNALVGRVQVIEGVLR